MMFQTEAKMQAWRALAIFADRSECLIYVGRSTSQVREGYAEAFMEILDDEERAQVQRIELQCWQGAADQGHWLQKNTLAIPTAKPAAASDPGPRLLPFRKPAAQPTPVAQLAQLGQENTEVPAPRPLGKRLATTG
jgi:hypothetical protein